MATASNNWAALLEEQAAKLKDKPFVYVVYQDRSVSYADMDLNANRIANFLLNMGVAPGDGIATLMNNSPQFLDVFFGIQKIGMYVNTVNTSLRGDELAFTIDNSDTKYLVVDYDLIDLYKSVADKTPQVKRVIVNTLEAPEGYKVPEGMIDLKDAYHIDLPTTKPDGEIRRELHPHAHVHIRHHRPAQGRGLALQQEHRGPAEDACGHDTQPGIGILHRPPPVPRQRPVCHHHLCTYRGLHRGPVQAILRQPLLGRDLEVQGDLLQHHRRHHPHPHEAAGKPLREEPPGDQGLLRRMPCRPVGAL